MEKNQVTELEMEGKVIKNINQKKNKYQKCIKTIFFK